MIVRHTHTPHIFLTGLIAIIISANALAQHDGLYPEPPPANAAFVRVIHAFAGTGAISASVGDRVYPELAFQEASDYYVVLEGEHQVKIADDGQEISLSAGTFYTLAVTAGEEGPHITLIEEAIANNAAKALLSLINLSHEVVDLRLADGSMMVLEAVESMGIASIEVNPISVSLAVFAAEEPIAVFEDLQLQRSVYTAVAIDGAEGLEAIWLLTQIGGEE